MRLKAVTNITSSTTGTGGVGAGIEPTRVPGIISRPDRPMTIRDLLMPGRTASDSIEFVQESGFQNMAAPVAEGADKPQSDLSFELKTTPVRTIAHWMRASKQVLADIPLLQSYIDGRLRYGLQYVEEQQILAGHGLRRRSAGNRRHEDQDAAPGHPAGSPSRVPRQRHRAQPDRLGRHRTGDRFERSLHLGQCRGRRPASHVASAGG
ncbi:hypothetical protein G6F35_015378 [Rhizopus arrhizus]|nr:hypothetical protein G6F35_015378 [Rhizopus arrhizus]